MSSAFCFWCIVTGVNVRNHNLKTYFPQKEISSTCIMKDVKLMLINMCSIYFLVDKVSLIFLSFYNYHNIVLSILNIKCVINISRIFFLYDFFCLFFNYIIL